MIARRFLSWYECTFRSRHRRTAVALSSPFFESAPGLLIVSDPLPPLILSFPCGFLPLVLRASAFVTSLYLKDALHGVIMGPEKTKGAAAQAP